MYAASINNREVSLVLSIDELRMLNCALREVADGALLPDAVFEQRVGAPRDDVRTLLSSVHSVLCAAEEMTPPRGR